MNGPRVAPGGSGGGGPLAVPVGGERAAAAIRAAASSVVEERFADVPRPIFERSVPGSLGLRTIVGLVIDTGRVARTGRVFSAVASSNPTPPPTNGGGGPPKEDVGPPSEDLPDGAKLGTRLINGGCASCSRANLITSASRASLARITSRCATRRARASSSSCADETLDARALPRTLPSRLPPSVGGITQSNLSRQPVCKSGDLTSLRRRTDQALNPRSGQEQIPCTVTTVTRYGSFLRPLPYGQRNALSSRFRCRSGKTPTRASLAP